MARKAGSQPQAPRTRRRQAGGYAARSRPSRTERDRTEEVQRQAWEQWERTFDAMPDLVAILDSNQRIVRANRAMRETFGPGIVGTRCFECFHREDRPPAFCPFAPLAVNGRERREEVFIEHLGKHFMVTVSPLLDAEGRPDGCVHVAHDITEHKRAESALSRQKQFLAHVVDAVADPVFVKDEQHRWTTLNDAFCRFLGHSREELVGKSDFDVFPREEAEVFRAKDDEVLATGEENVNEEMFTDAGGTQHVIATKKSVFRDPETGSRVLVGVIRDITEQRRAEESLRQHNAQLEALRQVSLGITAQLELDKLLRSITEHAQALFGADAGELFLYRAEREELELAVIVGTDEPRVSQVLRRGEGLAGRIWDRGQPLVVDRCANWPETMGAGEAFPWASAVSAPIRWRGLLLGVLGVLSVRPGTFSAADGELLELFATQAAVAMVNARLFAEVEQLAVVDELTALFNRRGLLTLGTREVERARRFGHPLAALFIDLDHFKQLNDCHSHEVGDRVLREVSARINSSVREIDVAARFGGEEFVVLLVETGLHGAREVAERLRQAIEATSVATDHGRARVTVSIGVAAVRPGAADLDWLVHRADEAMYAAKQAGRNRVVAQED